MMRSSVVIWKIVITNARHMVQNACIYNMVPIMATGEKHCMKRLKFA